MKKLGLFISILLVASKSFYGQVIATGALASVPDGGSPNNPNTDVLAGCDNGCDEQTLYTWFAPLSGKVCNGTAVGGNYANGNPNTEGHWPMQVSILIPSGCIVDVVADYGGACNDATGGPCDNTVAHCHDSRMDESDAGHFYDIVGINLGFNNPGTTVGNNTGSGNVGTCAFGIGGSGETNPPYCLHGGATAVDGTAGMGCYIDKTGCGSTASNGNADVTCTKTGLTNQSITIWGLGDRGDELITYTVTQTSGAGTCATLGIVVLPVEIIGIAAYRNSENSITIGWSTATETNNNYFMVEYSLDGTNFINYKEVKGAGNSNSRRDYTCGFTEDIGGATPYFRLKQVDNNGKFKYSQIVTLGSQLGYPNKTLSQVNSYYNTDKDKIITRFKLDAPTQVSFSLYDIAGREVYNSSNQFSEGNNQFLIPAPDISGVYILVYQNGSNTPIHKKLMVTK